MASKDNGKLLRRAPVESERSGDSSGATPPPDPEVLARAKRRRFSAAYKLGILEEADACSEPGAIAALLRREGLYSSHLAEWRRARVGRGGGCAPGPPLFPLRGAVERWYAVGVGAVVADEVLFGIGDLEREPMDQLQGVEAQRRPGGATGTGPAK